MKKQITRYERPSVEVEFDQEALTRTGCCRFVPVVLRICGTSENTMLTVTFERVRPLEVEGEHSEEYDVYPSAEDFRVCTPGNPRGYREYAGAFLARAHETETGTLHIKLESSSSVLTEAFFRLDSRQAKPLFTLAKGRFKAIRFLPQLRSQEERNALSGLFLASVHVRELLAIEEDDNNKQECDIQMVPLFPPNE
jgi:hypothetical protein